MASESMKTLGTSAAGAMPAETETQSLLFLLPLSVMGLLWPPERVVVGVKVCKLLRRNLIAHCSSIDLVQNVNARSSEFCISDDFRRLPQHLKVKLRWKTRYSSTSLSPRNELWRLAGLLRECQGLTHLDLSKTMMGDNEAETLADSLRGCTGLTHLNLSENCIREKGARGLAGVLGKYKALVHLDLSWNCIGAGGAGKLAEVLGECKVLAHLGLRCTGIGDEGAKRLAGVLGECKALERLDLSNNILGAEGVWSLAAVLVECRALAHLNLSDNLMSGREEMARLAEQGTGSCKIIEFA